MSKELLKRAAVVLREIWDNDNCYCAPSVIELQKEIVAYLAQPEPEPVVQVVEINHSKLIPNAILTCYVAADGQIPKVKDFLYTTPPDQSARIAELARDTVRLMETITDLRHQLAALQVREPMLLDDADIDDMCDSKAGENGCSYDFARAIEQAVLRNNGFKVEE